LSRGKLLMPGNNNPYIPTTDALLLAWADNFSAVITANPGDYGLIAGQAVTFAALFTTFESALATATDPGTRTSVTVAAKDAARAAMVTNARMLARIALAFPTVTPGDLTAAGLIVRNTVPTPIPAPVTVPILGLLNCIGKVVTLAFADELTPSSKYKPFGVTSLQLFMKTGAVPPASPADAEFVAAYGRWPARVDLSTLPAGTQLHFIARWATRRGLTGPQSAVVSAVLQA